MLCHSEVEADAGADEGAKCEDHQEVHGTKFENHLEVYGTKCLNSRYIGPQQVAFQLLIKKVYSDLMHHFLALFNAFWHILSMFPCISEIGDMKKIPKIKLFRALISFFVSAQLFCT